MIQTFRQLYFQKFLQRPKTCLFEGELEIA
jgi:hypothetical protein